MEINSLELYRVFYEVAKTKSITRAAERLFTGQPSVSKSIKRLEEVLQTTLFVRSRSGVTLTADGETLFTHIDRAMEEINQGELAVRKASAQTRGKLTLGVSSTLYNLAVAPHFKGFLDAHPNFTVNITDNSKSYRIIEMVKRGSLDLGIISRPISLDGIEFIPISSIDEIVVAAPQYLSRFDTSDITSFFSQAALISLEDGNIARDYNDRFFSELGIDAEPEIITSNMDFIIELATLGVGVGIVYRQIVEQELLTGDLVALDFLPSIPPRDIGIAICKGRLRTFAMKEFIDYYSMPSNA